MEGYDTVINKKVYTVDNPALISFCKTYVNEYDSQKSLKAWEQSQKRINKARASQMLESISAWLIIKDLYTLKENLTNRERNIYESILRYEERFGECPLESYSKLQENMSSNCIKNLKTLIPLYDFMEILGRDKFINYLKGEVKRNYQNYERLLKTPLQEHWSSKMRELKKYLKDNKATSNIIVVFE